MMKKTILTLLVLAFATFSFAQYDPEALAVLDAMSANYKKTEAFKASFTVKLVNKQASLDESNSGKITVKGAMFVLDVADQKIFNNGTDVYTYSEELAEVTISSFDDEEAEITLGNVYELYKEGFKYALISKMGNGDRVVHLNPESRDKTYFRIEMIIDSSDKLKSFTVYEKTNNVYTYSITEYEEISVEDSFFTFDTSKYPNVEVIDFR